MNLKTKIRIVGIIVILVSFLVLHYDDSTKPNLATHQKYFLIFVGLFLIGLVMLFQKGLLKAFKPRCQCCKCQNCYRNHNHWTHDDNDTRRSHY